MLKLTKRSTTKRTATVVADLEKTETNRTTEEAPLQSTTMFDVEFYPGRRLIMSSFRGQTMIHIREYAIVGERQYPTKKGASFTPGRLSVLRRSLSNINEALRQQEVNESMGVTVEGEVLYKAHLGAGIFASIGEKFYGVSLRKHWIPEGQLVAVPTKNGIFIPVSQWKTLQKKLGELETAHPDLLLAQECAISHDNQLGMLDCYECMPFGWM